ncbi:MAG: HDOD domain-containing protein [Hydrogenophilus sp.]|nr:HDOD domain-containing protein [Hydrogenophilus sp.]
MTIHSSRRERGAEFVLSQVEEEGRLPQPSEEVKKLLSVLENEEAGLPEVASQVQADPVLSARVLRVANSPAYALPRPATSVTPDVLMRVGLTTLRHLIAGFGILDRYRRGAVAGLEYETFWSKSLLVGVLAAQIGTTLRLAPASDLFTLGLLLDFGVLVLAEWRPEEVGRAMAGDRRSAARREALRRVFEVHPWRVTAAAMARWGLPRVFFQAVNRLAEAEEGGMALGEGEVPLRVERVALLLALSEALAGYFVETHGEEPKHEWEAWMRALGVGAEELPAKVSEALKEWEAWLSLLQLPAADLVAGSTERLGRWAPPERVPITLMVVDDDPVLLRLLPRVMQRPEWTIVTFSDSREALRSAAEQMPDAVVVDLLMPGLDGWGFIEQLRQLPKGERPHVIVLSVLEEREALIRAFEAGADDFVNKPFDPRLLEARLSPAIRRKQSAASEKRRVGAMWDEEVELFSRAYLEERLPQELALAARVMQPVSLLLLGCANGSRKELYEMGRWLTGFVRASDVLGRFAEKELYLLLPATPAVGVERLVRRLREQRLCGERNSEQETFRRIPKWYRAGTFELERLGEAAESRCDWHECAALWLRELTAAPVYFLSAELPGGR